MADYSGYFLKGLAGGITTGVNLGQQIQEMNWQKKQRKQLEERQKKMLEVGNLFNAKVKEIFADNIISDEEESQLITIYLSGGYEFMDHYGNAMSHISGMKDKELRQEFEWMDSFIDMTSGFSPDAIPEIYDSFEKQFITSEKGKNYFAANKRMQEKRYEVAQARPTAEVFTSAEALREKYPEAGVKYTDEGYVPTFGEPTVKTPSAADRKLDWAIDSYNKGRITFNELSKYMGTYIAPEEMSAKEKEIELAKQYGATNKEIKNKLLGKGIGTTAPPTAPAIENVRADILNADTLEDAQRIYDNQVRKYGKEGLMINLPKDWADTQEGYLMNIRTCINNLIDEKGWLKKGTLTSAEVGVDFKGEQSVEEIYEMLRKEYMKYRDMLEKLGIDISQFPELKPLEEIEKVGLGEGFWGFGKQKGQYKSIYYTETTPTPTKTPTLPNVYP